MAEQKGGLLARRRAPSRLQAPADLVPTIEDLAGSEQQSCKAMSAPNWPAGLSHPVRDCEHRDPPAAGGGSTTPSGWAPDGRCSSTPIPPFRPSSTPTRSAPPPARSSTPSTYRRRPATRSRRPACSPPAPGATWSPARLDDLLAARAEWGRAHGVGPADLDASWEEDLAKSAVFDATTIVLQAAADPEFGADMVDHLEHCHAMLGETLVGLLDTIGDRVLDDGVLARAVEDAHVWQGATLGDRVGVEAQLALRCDPPAVLAFLAAI